MKINTVIVYRVAYVPIELTMLSCLSKSRCTYSLTFAAWPCHNQSPIVEIHHHLKSHTLNDVLLSFPWPCYIVKAHILLLYYYHCYVDTFTGCYRHSLWNHFFGSWHLGKWRIFISLGPQIFLKMLTEPGGQVLEVAHVLDSFLDQYK